MSGARRNSLSVALASLCSGICVAGGARAELGVSIHYQSDEQLDVARRLSSELSSEGYAVTVAKVFDTRPCDATRSQPLTASRGTGAWIRLVGSSAAEKIVASICYVGTQPLVLEASTSAPSSEPRRLALATAEALNGLRSKLPASVVVADSVPVRRESPSRDRAAAVLDVRSPSPGQLANRAEFGAGLLVNFPDLPPAPGVTARVSVGVASSLGIVMDAFVPVAGSEVASPEVRARVRTAWLRVGPRVGGPFQDMYLSGAVLAGPAVTWATATAQSPRRGTADLTMGAVTSVAAFLEYPHRSTIFACASASVSALLPGVRVKLGDRAPSAHGAWLLDGAVGIGARWGGGP
jgi:hypothetical protein